MSDLFMDLGGVSFFQWTHTDSPAEAGEVALDDNSPPMAHQYADNAHYRSRGKQYLSTIESS